MRIELFGNSVSALVCGQRSPGRTYLTYSSVLRDLHVGGVDFDVVSHARIYGLISDCAGKWAVPLAQSRPDVVVLQYGIGEAFPKVFPKRVNYHLLGVARHGGAGRDCYWVMARRVLLGLHAVERRLDPRLPIWWCRHSPRRFERELETVCRKIQQQIGSRLVLMTAYYAAPPTPFVTTKMHRRVDLMNEAIHRVAKSVDAQVFPLDEMVASLGPTALPDGLHMSVEAHREIGEQLARFLVLTRVTQVA